MAQNAHSATAPASGTAAHAAQTRNGFICLFTTYAIWGMLPLYFYLMASSSALEIVLSRVIFSLAFCAVLLPIFRLTKPFNRAVRTPRTMGILTVASLLIGANWMIYVYSTTHGHTIDMSLGYFINPLVSVALGGRVPARAAAKSSVDRYWDFDRGGADYERGVRTDSVAGFGCCLHLRNVWAAQGAGGVKCASGGVAIA